MDTFLSQPEGLDEIMTNSGTAPANSVTTETASCFPNFLKLPTEIRLMIWRCMLPGPRIVQVTSRFKKLTPVPIGEKMKAIALTALCQPPINLQVCRESRMEALKEYELAFPSKKFAARIYVNFAIDTILITHLNSWLPVTTIKPLGVQKSKSKKPAILHAEFQKIKYLALGGCFTSTNRLIDTENFPNLVEVGIIVNIERLHSRETGYLRLRKVDRPMHGSYFPWVVGSVDKWIDDMETLAIISGDGYRSPKVAYFDFSYGVAKKKTLVRAKAKTSALNDHSL